MSLRCSSNIRDPTESYNGFSPLPAQVEKKNVRSVVVEGVGRSSSGCEATQTGEKNE